MCLCLSGKALPSLSTPNSQPSCVRVSSPPLIQTACISWKTPTHPAAGHLKPFPAELMLSVPGRQSSSLFPDKLLSTHGLVSLPSRLQLQTCWSSGKHRQEEDGRDIFVQDTCSQFLSAAVIKKKKNNNNNYYTQATGEERVSFCHH